MIRLSAFIEANTGDEGLFCGFYGWVLKSFNVRK